MYKLLFSTSKTIEQAAFSLHYPRLANGHWEIARDIASVLAMIQTQGSPSLIIMDQSFLPETRNLIQMHCLLNRLPVPSIISLP